MMRGIALGACLLALVAADEGAAWGQEGHGIVAEIAQRRLESEAGGEVQRLLQSEFPAGVKGPISFASIASWADDWRSEHGETSNWHFVDIPVDRHDGNPPESVLYDEALDCPPATHPRGTCTIKALEEQLAILKTPEAASDAAGTARRVMALKFIVHLVGDLHPPLHCAERDGDAGGNGFHVFYSGPHQEPGEVHTNLHKAWDSLIVVDREYAWGSYANRLEKEYLEDHDAEEMAAGSLIDWANECHAVALTVYVIVPPDLTRRARS